MRVRSKRYKKESQQSVKEALSLAEAVEKIKSFKSVKFDQSIECVLHLGIDSKQADQSVRGSLSLPHGIGKQKTVVAFCEDSDIEAAKSAGAVCTTATAGSREKEFSHWGVRPERLIGRRASRYRSDVAPPVRPLS